MNAMNCENCKSTEEKGAPSVPYLVHEGEMFRMEEINRRLVVVAALEAVALVLMIAALTILH